ncbi:MAG TPA: D-glycero-beta-D-manno-heptose 1-phosphate adenylyltransferase [bacterium]|nr:D-glycero-beta-D-manno-heptose 1-phosphate adenylyltransferase [bacterium]HOL47461.1 D-glycero-beta-D-manno-heptose 1-phosphate adenylyltransferase [bacterium]HPQ18941.1 D-glycero-beta-D-manno-heptose 1-phosphate adenylyltransferase [bacterium]
MSKKKIVKIDKLIKIIEQLKKKNKIIVWTNGCFDIIHYGHIYYLKKAKEFGDILIVGLNSDSSVKKLKGNDRPIFKEKFRANVLAALEVIDFITIFNEETPYNYIKKIKPHYIVKGGDYKKEDVVGKDIVEKYGKDVIIIPYLKNFSTTNIIKKINLL